MAHLPTKTHISFLEYSPWAQRPRPSGYLGVSRRADSLVTPCAGLENLNVTFGCDEIAALLLSPSKVHSFIQKTTQTSGWPYSTPCQLPKRRTHLSTSKRGTSPKKKAKTSSKRPSSVGRASASCALRRSSKGSRSWHRLR